MNLFYCACWGTVMRDLCRYNCSQQRKLKNLKHGVSVYKRRNVQSITCLQSFGSQRVKSCYERIMKISFVSFNWLNICRIPITPLQLIDLYFFTCWLLHTVLHFNARNSTFSMHYVLYFYIHSVLLSLSTLSKLQALLSPQQCRSPLHRERDLGGPRKGPS